MNNLNLDIAAIEESILAKEFSSIQNKIDELLILNPDHPELLYFKGICLFHTNEVDESLNYFFKAKDLDTKNSNKYNDGIALVYKTTGDHFYNNDNIDEARVYIIRALSWFLNQICYFWLMLILNLIKIIKRLLNYMTIYSYLILIMFLCIII